MKTSGWSEAKRSALRSHLVRVRVRVRVRVQVWLGLGSGLGLEFGLGLGLGLALRSLRSLLGQREAGLVVGEEYAAQRRSIIHAEE